MTLHQRAIEWLVTQIPNAVNNHYAREPLKFDGLIPDIIADGMIHEVEVESDKSTYAQIQKTKILWVIIPNPQVFKQINVVGENNNQFAILQAFSNKFLDEEEERKELERNINSLKTKRNRLVREIEIFQKQHKVKEGEARKVFYLLPSFQFKKDLNPSKCAICNNESDIVISSEDIPQYGLCNRHFGELIKIEEGSK
jgi:hypothetical protein